MTDPSTGAVDSVDNDRINRLHAELCKVFTNPTRIQILQLLRERERSVTELVRELGLPQPNVSQHLTVMRNRGVLAWRRDGSAVRYRVAHPKVLQAFDLIREVLVEELRQATRLTRK